MQNELRLRWLDIVVAIRGDVRVRDYLATAEPWEAWGWRAPELTTASPTSTVEISQASRSYVSRDGQRAHLFAAPEEVLRIPSLAIRLVYSVWVMACTSRGRYPIHGAAVRLNRRAVVLLGAPGAGKTITALLACQRLGAALVAGDLAVIHQTSAGAELLDRGEQTLRLRPDALSLLGVTRSNATTPATKIALRPADVGIKVLEPPVAVDRFVFVRVDPAMTGSQVTLGQESHLIRARFRDALWYSTRLVSGAARLGRSSVEVPLLGADRQSVRTRDAFADALVDSGRLAEVCGPAESVAHRLGEIA